MDVAAAIFLMGILGFFFGFLSFLAGVKEIQTEAVKRGKAEWVADSSGNTTFKWKE